MAAEENVSALVERVDKVSVSATTTTMTDEDDEATRVEGDARNGDAGSSGEPRLWGFETRELYKLAHNFYKGEPLCFSLVI